MKATQILWVVLLVSLCGCSSSSPIDNQIGIAKFYGNYVSGDYEDRDEGKDWVAVSILPQTEKQVRVSIRSRGDDRRPLCRFDAMAMMRSKDTLIVEYKDEDISFAFHGKRLMIQMVNQEKNELLKEFSFNGTTIAGVYEHIADSLDQRQIDQRSYYSRLCFDKYVVEASVSGNALTVESDFLSANGKKAVKNITGYKVVNTIIADIDYNKIPEVYILLQDSNDLGNLVGFCLNNEGGIEDITCPRVKDNPTISLGYLGEDQIILSNNKLLHRFPIYRGNDTYDRPTGGIRQIEYELKDYESHHILYIDRVLDL